MALSTLRPRMSFLPSGPVSEPTSVRNLLGDYGDEINLRPIYQRDIKWKKLHMCNLIGTVMNQGLIPGIILYKLQAEERVAGCPFRYEMVDGQHRYFALNKFFKSELVTEAGGKPFLITWIYRDKTANRDIHILYKENDATKEWIAQNRGLAFDYMTEDEQDVFNSYKIDKKEIKDRLTLDQRREIFTKLQCGSPVRGSDFYKNTNDVRLIRFIVDEMKLEGTMKAVLANRCWMNPKNYWLHWVIRFYLILTTPEDSTAEDEFKIRDAAITTLIKDESPRLTSTDDDETEMKITITRFFAFLDSLPKGVKLSPCHFYALFYYIAYADEGREDILRGHINEWANNQQVKPWKKAWENREVGGDDSERAMFFLSCVDELERIRLPAREPEARRSIPKKLRLRVWCAYFGSEEEDGYCFCCGDTIAFQKEYEACHLIAHKHGGPDSFENLRPGCRSCNSSMGTQDMRDFKAQYYPEIHTPL